MLDDHQSTTFQAADKVYDISSIVEANFIFLLEKLNHDNKLPSNILKNLIKTNNLITDEIWENNSHRIKSLKNELLDKEVSISQSNKPMEIFKYYGWLIEEFLRKMITDEGEGKPVLLLSYIIEAFQSSLRYLSYIQLAQIITKPEHVKNNSVVDFFNRSEKGFKRFDFLNFLLTTKDLLYNQDNFVEDMQKFIIELFDKSSNLYQTALFLENHRCQLLNKKIVENKNLDILLDKCFTALIYWLEKIAFLAKYRLVSIKDIYLNYHFGAAKTFVHSFAELHNIYKMRFKKETDIKTKYIKNYFTFSNSILLFKGKNADTCLDNLDEKNYISLSPLIIDKSVWAKVDKQKPDIYYYNGKNEKEYVFANYSNELVCYNEVEPKSIKKLEITEEDKEDLNSKKLFKQLARILNPVVN